MDQSKNKELKIKSFRVDEDTFEKFKVIASKEFGNQGQCLDALINLYEMENSKSALLERKLEIESFQDYLNKINQLFVTSLQMSKDAEGRVKEEYLRQLSTKDTTIERLQIREKENLEKVNSYKERFKQLEEEVLEFKKVNKALELDKSTLSQLVTRNHELLEKNKKEIEKINEYKIYKNENETLKKQINSMENEIFSKENQIKEVGLEVDLLKKENNFLEKKVEELRKEVDSYRVLSEAIRKDHRKELELLESKYSKIIKNDSEKLVERLNLEKELERKTLELTIKKLEQEKEMLEFKLNISK